MNPTKVHFFVSDPETNSLIKGRGEVLHFCDTHAIVACYEDGCFYPVDYYHLIWEGHGVVIDFRAALDLLIEAHS